MIREDFICRKLQLIGEDLGRLVRFKDLTLDQLLADDIRLAAVERIIERIVMRAVGVNEHLLAERLPPDARRTLPGHLSRPSGCRALYPGIRPGDRRQRRAEEYPGA